MKTYLYRALKSTITFLAFVSLFHSGSQFLAPAKNRRFLQFIHNQYQLLQTGFLQYTEAVTTSLISIERFHRGRGLFLYILWQQGFYAESSKLGKLTSEILVDSEKLVFEYLQSTIEIEWVTHLVYRSCIPPIGLYTKIPISLWQ